MQKSKRKNHFAPETHPIPSGGGLYEKTIQCIGWFFHKDHHQKESDEFLERNDFFFLIFAIPGIVGLFIGMQNGYNLFFWIGLGISIDGATYFFVHDIFIHQRADE